MTPAQVPKVGVWRTKVSRTVEEAVALEVLEEGGGLAAWDDETVQTVELLGTTNRGVVRRRVEDNALAWAS